MNRRSFLASTAASAVPAIAGCAVLSGGDGSSGSPPLEPVTRWALPVDEGEDPGDSYSVESIAPTALSEATDVPVRDVRLVGNRYSPIWDAAGVDGMERTTVVNAEARSQLESYHVFEGAFSAAAVKDRLPDDVVRPERRLGTYEDYELFGAMTHTHDWSVAYAVTDGTAIRTTPSGSATGDGSGLVAAFEELVDTAEGRSDAVTDQLDDAKTVAERLDARLLTRVGLTDPDRDDRLLAGTFRGTVAIGDTVGASDDGITRRFVHRFEDRDALERAPIGTWLDGFRNLAAVRNVSTSTAGRIHETVVTAPAELHVQSWVLGVTPPPRDV